jgi:hypothetical protein
MYKHTIEEFDNLILDSVRTQYSQYEIGEDLLNVLTLRVIRNNKKIQYRFYEVLEYSQLGINNEINEFYIDTSDNWHKKYMEHYTKGNQKSYGKEEKITDIKFVHYIFNLNGICFNILAQSYIIDEDGFLEKYRTKSEKIRKIVS